MKCDAGLLGYEGDLEEICGLCIASNDTLLQFENSLCEASDLLNDYYGSDLVEGYLSSDIRDLERMIFISYGFWNSICNQSFKGGCTFI